jgi:hypothetical protein
MPAETLIEWLKDKKKRFDDEVKRRKQVLVSER